MGAKIVFIYFSEDCKEKKRSKLALLVK